MRHRRICTDRDAACRRSIFDAGTLSADRLEILTADSATFANGSNTVAALGDVTVAFDIGEGVTVDP